MDCTCSGKSVLVFPSYMYPLLSVSMTLCTKQTYVPFQLCLNKQQRSLQAAASDSGMVTEPVLFTTTGPNEWPYCCWWVMVDSRFSLWVSFNLYFLTALESHWLVNYMMLPRILHNFLLLPLLLSASSSSGLWTPIEEGWMKQRALRFNWDPMLAAHSQTLMHSL